ncbi:MAG: response regulator transcription factor [Clostridiales bacterium]|nr:response regulator transcription factor [Clostridiales bacterium]
MKLLIVEDEKMLQTIIAKGLKKYGYAVDKADDGEMALQMFMENEYDLIVLDLNLPKVDGMDVLRQIRQENQQIKVLILSARSDIEDRIAGLDDGANDYLVKPFDFKELEARIRCLLRQRVVMDDLILTNGLLLIDTKKKMACYDGVPLELTKKEYGILEYLMVHKDEVVSAETLIEHVWDSEVDLFSNTFKFHMSSLRKKISNVSNQDLIKNIRGVGYQIGN